MDGSKAIEHRDIWVKVFKNRQSKICGRQPLKDLSASFNFFKGCLLQILPGPFLNTLTYISVKVIYDNSDMFGEHKENILVNIYIKKNFPIV